MRAFVFPGQGAQAIGMGRALAEAYPAARAVFDEVDDVLGEKLSALIWEGDADTLTLTRNAQPALMATSMAAMRALEAEGASIGAAGVVAGHSLGEYSALCAAGALTLADTARLLRIRGDAMQAAVPEGVGAMAAILGLDFDAVAKICAEASEAGAICEAANDNDPSQTVISGHKPAVERAMALCKEAGAKRALPLPVSAPFHSSLMQPAAERMAEALAAVELKAPAVPVIANVTAAPVTDPSEIRDLLVRQVTGSVRWRESVMWMAENDVTESWEIGSGKALTGMIRRIAKEMQTRTIGTPEDVSATVESLTEKKEASDV
ncbi:ACP S-malonyltransferase [Pseudoroseicyclus sp. H15]